MFRVTKTDQLGNFFRGVFGPSVVYILYKRTEEQMRLADKTTTTRYESEDGKDWIVVRAEITKKEHMDLTRDLNPSAESRNVGEFYDMFEKFFKLVMLDWSLTEEVDGKERPVAPTLQLYYDLDTESAGQIDAWLNKHMQEKFGREVEELEGEVSS